MPSQCKHEIKIRNEARRVGRKVVWQSAISRPLLLKFDQSKRELFYTTRNIITPKNQSKRGTFEQSRYKEI